MLNRLKELESFINNDICIDRAKTLLIAIDNRNPSINIERRFNIFPKSYSSQADYYLLVYLYLNHARLYLTVSNDYIFYYLTDNKTEANIMGGKINADAGSVEIKKIVNMLIHEHE